MEGGRQSEGERESVTGKGSGEGVRIRRKEVGRENGSRWRRGEREESVLDGTSWRQPAARGWRKMALIAE